MEENRARTIRHIFEEAEKNILCELNAELYKYKDFHVNETDQKYIKELDIMKMELAKKGEIILNLTKTIEKYIQENQILKIENETMKNYTTHHINIINQIKHEASQKNSQYESTIEQMNQNYNTLMNMYMNGSNGNGSYVNGPQTIVDTNQYNPVYYPPPQEQVQEERMSSFIQPNYSPIQSSAPNQESFLAFRDAFLQKMNELRSTNSSST